MTRFYSNLHIRDVEREELFKELVDIYGEQNETVEDIELESPDDVEFMDPSGPEEVRFFLAPAINNWTSIFTERVTLAEELAHQLSGRMNTWCVYLWTDPQKAWGYALFQDGKTIDEFVSNLEYYDRSGSGHSEEHKSGNPVSFSELIEEPNTEREIIDLLKTAREHTQKKNLEPEQIGNEFSMFRRALGIPHAASDYEYIAQGDSRNLLKDDEFVHFTF